MPSAQDGPSTPLFRPLPFSGNVTFSELAEAAISEEMKCALEHAPGGSCVAWGIPFEIGDAVMIDDQAVSVAIDPTTARWFIFMHTSDLRPVEPGPDGFITPMRGQGQLGPSCAVGIVDSLYDLSVIAGSGGLTTAPRPSRWRYRACERG